MICQVIYCRWDEVSFRVQKTWGSTLGRMFYVWRVWRILLCFAIFAIVTMFLLLMMSCGNRRAAGEQFLDDFPDSRLLVLTTVVMRTIVVGWRKNISVLCVAAIILTCCSRIGVCTV